MGAPITLSLASLITLVSILLSDFTPNSCTTATFKNFDPKQWVLLLFNYVGKGHLAYEMGSLLWKGAILEVSIGSRQFGYMLLKLLLICDGLLITTGGVMQVWGAPQLYPSICQARLSGLLFALNSVLNSSHDMYGFILPGSYWSLCRVIIEANTAVELCLVRILFPGVPFSGPVCGTLAGLLYFHASQLVTICRQPRSLWTINERGLVWRCRSCDFRNGVYFSSCQVCGEQRRQSIFVGGDIVRILWNPGWQSQEVAPAETCAQKCRVSRHTNTNISRQVEVRTDCLWDSFDGCLLGTGIQWRTAGLLKQGFLALNLM